MQITNTKTVSLNGKSIGTWEDVWSNYPDDRETLFNALADFARSYTGEADQQTLQLHLTAARAELEVTASQLRETNAAQAKRIAELEAQLKTEDGRDWEGLVLGWMNSALSKRIRTMGGAITEARLLGSAFGHSVELLQSEYIGLLAALESQEAGASQEEMDEITELFKNNGFA